MADVTEVFADLVRLQIELWNAVDNRLRTELDLPLTQYWPMRVMSSRGSCRVFDIADELALSIGGVSKIVDRIENTGYCERRSNPDDRRSSLIELTAAGRATTAAADRLYEAELTHRLGAAVTPRALQQLGATLRTLRTASHTIDAESEPGKQGGQSEPDKGLEAHP